MRLYQLLAMGNKRTRQLSLGVIHFSIQNEGNVRTQWKSLSRLKPKERLQILSLFLKVNTLLLR